MSLLTIATKALKGISGFDIPASFYSNTNLTAVLCVALANECGQDLEKEIRWQQLIDEHTFATVDGTATYDLPTGFRAFANMSQWDRTNLWRLTGPTQSIVWQWLKSGISVASTNNAWFTVRGNSFTIYPTPTSVRTIAFDYYSKNWIEYQIAPGTYTNEWSADLDTSRLDEDLITADLKWRFLQAKGMPFEPEYKRYEFLKDLARDDNGPRGAIDMGRPLPGGFGNNIPDTGFGQ
jgi:hypothetical protein